MDMSVISRVAGWIEDLWTGSGKATADLPEDPGEVTFVVLDTETTGLDPAQDRILSIGAVRLREGSIRVRESVEYFLEQAHFDRLSVPIHGILKTGKNPRISEKAALEALLGFIGDSPLVGHHVAFDRIMLQKACDRQGLTGPDNPLIDTALLYRHTLIKSPLLRKKERYTLDDLARKFDLSCKDRHTALGDAYITAMAFLYIVSRLREKQPLTTRNLLKMGRPR